MPPHKHIHTHTTPARPFFRLSTSCTSIPTCSKPRHNAHPDPSPVRPPSHPKQEIPFPDADHTSFRIYSSADHRTAQRRIGAEPHPVHHTPRVSAVAYQLVGLEQQYVIGRINNLSRSGSFQYAFLAMVIFFSGTHASGGTIVAE